MKVQNSQDIISQAEYISDILNDASQGNLHAMNLADNFGLIYTRPTFEKIINYKYKVAFNNGFGKSRYEYLTMRDIIKLNDKLINYQYNDEIAAWFSMLESSQFLCIIEDAMIDLNKKGPYNVDEIVCIILDTGCDIYDAVLYSKGVEK